MIFRVHRSKIKSVFLYIFCYADDSDLHNAPASHKNRVDIASSINLDLRRLKNWGSQNLVNFNVVKTQCCLISRRIGINLPDISFDSNSLEFSNKISILSVTLGPGLSWNDHISTTVKAVACKLGLLFRSRRYFTPSSLLTLYEAQIRPCLEYGSHQWRGASNHTGCNSEASN